MLSMGKERWRLEWRLRQAHGWRHRMRPLHVGACALCGSFSGDFSAIEAALSLYPDASLTALRMPTETRNAYQVLLRQPGEANRIYGRTEILVSAATGDAVLVSDPFDEPPGRAFMAALFPVHTGQVLGLPGRVAVLATGCGLLALMVFGVMLFAARLQGRRRLAR